MLSTIKKILRKKTTYQVNDSKLKEKDEKSILKLASKIKGKKSSIAEKLEKISKEKKQRILTMEVSKHRGKESTFTLLTHAIFCENSQAVKDILRQAELSNLLKSVLSAKIINDNSLIYTPLTYAILCKNSKAIEEILKVSKENDILKDILNATTTMKYSDGRRATVTPLAYAILCGDSIAIEEILKVSKEKGILKDILNTTATIKYPGSREVTYTPLAHAMFWRDSKAIKEILVAAKENSILKDILNTTTTMKYLDREVTYTPLAYAILRKDSIAIEEILKISKENSILEDILNATITIKHQNSQEVTDKVLAALHDRKVIQKILDIARENDILKNILNAIITIKYQDGEEKICTPLTDTISCQSNEVFNITKAINQDGQEKTHIPFPTLDKRETELKLKEKRQKRQSRRDEGLNFNNGSSDKNVEIKVNRDILLQNSSGTENEINHTAVRNDVGVVKLPIESRVNVKAQNINATIVTSVILKTVVTSVALELRAGKIACVLSKPLTKLKEVAIACQGLALY